MMAADQKGKLSPLQIFGERNISAVYCHLMMRHTIAYTEKRAVIVNTQARIIMLALAIADLQA